MLVDEAASVALSISNTDASSVLFVLLPTLHSSTDAAVVRRNKRAVEDKLMAFLACTQVMTMITNLIRIDVAVESGVCIVFSCCIIIPIFILGLRQMELHDVSLMFHDSHHGGDKRKKTQQCNLFANWCLFHH